VKNTKFLIHADPGARSGFLAAWLTDNLAYSGFDVGATTNLDFYKIHTLSSIDQLVNFTGIKIRIKPSFKKLNLQLLLFLRKNVYTQLPNFTRNEFSLETFSKVYIFAKNCFEQDALLNYSYYDHVIDFCDTFDVDLLSDLYVKCNDRYPTIDNINCLQKNNKLNNIWMDQNNACNIAAMLYCTEINLNLKEENRLWSVPDIYNTVMPTDLYERVQTQIQKQNYQ